MKERSPRMAAQSQPNNSPAYPAGVISVDEIYTLAEAKRRLGWTDAGLRSAKRRGLRVLICGKRRYIAGDEIHRFLHAGSSTSGP